MIAAPTALAEAVTGPETPARRPHILVVDDEPVLLASLESSLENEGFDVLGAASGEEALALVSEHLLDLMILDVGLPGASGFEVCRRVRAISDLPVIFLTAADELSERLNGFDLGADDYVTKPVALPEVVRRVQAVLRRYQAQAAAVMLYGPNGLTMNHRTRELQVGGSSVDLTPREFALLALLLERRGQVLSVDAIALAIWGHGSLGERNFVEAQISRVRAKLSRAGVEDVIRTIRGIGYVVR